MHPGLVPNGNLEVLVVDTMHPQLAVPAFYTIVPGAHFRERATGTSVAMFTAKTDHGALRHGRRHRATDGHGATDCPANILSSSTWAAAIWIETIRKRRCPILAVPSTFHRRTRTFPAFTLTWASAIRNWVTMTGPLPYWPKAKNWIRNAPTFTTSWGFATSCAGSTERRSGILRKSSNWIPARPSTMRTSRPTTVTWEKKDEAVRYYRLALELDPSIDFARDNLERLTGRDQR
jgi:ribosomal protein S12 methylthiotransferase accessory factor